MKVNEEEMSMTNQRSEGASGANGLLAFLVGMLLGGLVGAVAMLLFAPRSGEKTRTLIQKRGAKVRHQAVESLEEVATEAGDKAHHFTNSVQKGAGDLQQQAQDLLGVGKN
jgi:gas vesicle protein